MTKQCDKTGEIEVLPLYVVRRKDVGSNLYVRMVAPTDVSRFIPNKKDRTFRVSLGTSNAKEAALIASPIIASKLSEWDKIRKSNVGAHFNSTPVLVPGYLSDGSGNTSDAIGPVARALTPQLISVIVATRMHSWVASDDRDRAFQDDDAFDEAVKFSEMSEAELRKFIARGAKPEQNSELMDQVLDAAEMLGTRISVSDPLFANLVQKFAIGERQIHSFLNARNKGDWPEVESVLPKVGHHLSDITELFRADKLRTAGTHYVGTGIAVWLSFIEFTGDVFFDEVTSKNVYDCMEHHLRVTKRWGPKYLGKVKTYLKDIFDLAITLSYLSGLNPIATLVKVPQLDKEQRNERDRPRYPLSAQQVNTLLASEWYNPLATQWRGQLRDDLGTRYFMPLISLLHGSRVREPLQLFTDEIVCVGGVNCFNFRVEFEKNEGDGKKVVAGDKEVIEVRADGWLPRSFKNDSALRMIPIHPKLLELGFLEYVAERRDVLGRNGPVFASALPQPGGASPKYGRAYEQAMLRFMKDDLKFPSGIGNHSNRHQFEDRVRSANSDVPWPAGMWQHLTGRRVPGQKDGNIARVGSEEYYGNGYSPKATLKWQNTVDFSDIMFPRPFNEWRRTNSHGIVRRRAGE